MHRHKSLVGARLAVDELAEGQRLIEFVARSGPGKWWLAQHARRKALESYLKEEKLGAGDEGRHSVMHLMADLAMTEADALYAGFQNDCVKGSTRRRRARPRGACLFRI